MTMTLNNLLAAYGKLDALSAVVVTGLQNDSRQVQPGDVFLAYPGAQVDGRKFIEQAWQRGAIAVLAETDSQSEFTVEIISAQRYLIHLPNLHAELGAIAATFFNHPSRQCKVIGVTGTNGKTTLCFMLAQALRQLGYSCAIIGTAGKGFLDRLTTTENTTPDALAVQRYLADYVNQGATHIAMEVSSHGIDQGRVYGVQFDTAVLTQIGRDHLDYHGTMEAYVAVKARLFYWPGLRHAVINGDDFFADRFLTKKNTLLTRYGLAAESSEVYAKNWQPHEQGSHALIERENTNVLLETPLWGQFNFYNLLAALSVLLGLDISLQESVGVLAHVVAPPGRLEKINATEYQPYVLVDYAHTPDALESVLLAVHQHAQARWQRGGKLICIFGCGGERDTGKRPLMGKVATQYADKVILTQDNPRSENPQTIMEQIQVGCDAPIPCEVIMDRAQAINEAIQQAQRDDVIVIAGKGHETVQIIQGRSIPSDDRVLARRALAKRNDV